MADTRESTAERSKMVTSPTNPSRQSSNAKSLTGDGAKQTTDAKDAERKQKIQAKLADQLAIILDVMNEWPCRMSDGNLPEPYISIEHGMLYLAMPIGGHVIRNVTVTSTDGKSRHNFSVNDLLVVPVDVTDLVTSKTTPVVTSNKQAGG